LRSDGTYTRKSADDSPDSHAWFLGNRAPRPEPVLASCFLVEPDPAVPEENPELAALASRVANELALCFVHAAEDIRRRAAGL